ncbi:conserved hypothetical protein [Talaromyces marneffei ATCC 18224]|uniref:Hsp70 family chaperone n=1 Tax=Talaromyces marneffei (strain ATCC 18224 / CBS 334.59 / QM 7333) TaxID=441960 RepID=B6QW44_TALMQ|nr:conserved hypothetical protein [Talaromyces marneffei ATCC 18224]
MTGRKVFQLIVTPEKEMEDPDLRPKKRNKTTKFAGTKPNTRESMRGTITQTNRKLNVGVDFGTTYSGFATWLTRSSEDVVPNRKWPHCAGYAEKVPSMLSYDMTNSNGPQVTAWGYGTKSSTYTYTWFKLGLGQDQGQEIYDDTLLYDGLGSIKCPDNLTYSDLAIDYLRHFYQHLLGILREQERTKTFELLSFHFILAVPAGWPDVSRCQIRYCAENAGFGSREGDRISLISEPEAAALAMFHSFSSKLEAGGTFKENTNVMVVDMGGGTVDLITYTIKSLKPFRVAEACVGSGAKCGSSTIDRHFQKLMEERFGGKYKNKSPKFIGPKSTFMNEFENVKRRFDNDTDSDTLPLDMELESSEYYDSDDGEVILKSEDLIEVFRPVVENVIGLIKEQAERTEAENEHPITAIILCGGLAGSGYIQSQLKNFCQETIPNTQVLIPPSPWSAICCGAAMSNTNSSFISSRRAWRCYGTVVHSPFIDEEHNRKNATKHPEGRMVQKMFWHIKKNDNLLCQEKYRWLKNASIHVGGKFGYEGVIEIYQCDSQEAPLWKSDKAVTRLGDLPIDLTHLDPSTRKKAVISYIPGRTPETKSVKVEIGQVVKSSSIVEFIARIGKRTVGLAEFDYKPIAKGEESIDDEDEEDEDHNAWLRPDSESP